MTRVTVADDVASKIRESEGPIELVDTQGHTVGVVRRPPTEAEIHRAMIRASQGSKRLSWEQVVAKVRDGVGE